MIRQRKAPTTSRIERQIITGMVVSTQFLKEIIPVIDSGGKFQTEFASTVSRWCIEYFQEYDSAPREFMEDLFLDKQRQMEQDQIDLVQDFLESISQEFERDDGKFNSQYILDKAERYFVEVSLKQAHAEMGRYLSNQDPIAAENAITAYKRPTMARVDGVDPYRDKDFVRSLHVGEEDNPDIILKLPGALGMATGPLEREFLVALQAESGVGKTWWLTFLARLSMMNGYNVPFFSLEMSQKKMGIRFWQDIMSIPTTDDPIRIPKFDCEKNQEGTCTLSRRRGRGALYEADESPDWITCTECTLDKEMLTTWFKVEERDTFHNELVIARMDQFERTGYLKKWGKVNLASFPENSWTTKDMFGHLDNLEYTTDLIPDVVISDYADKHKWSVSGDPRNSIGQIWADYKRLAQEKHCLVITASQSNTERGTGKVGKGSWAENIEKRRKIDLGLALNQNDEDVEKGIMWVTIDKIRHGEKVVSSKVAVTQCLAIGRPYLDSILVKNK